jgi:hypothetical protein
VKIRISVGDVSLRCDGLELSKREVLHLLRVAAGIAVAIQPYNEPEEAKTPIGFAAHVERAEPVVDDFSEFFEE